MPSDLRTASGNLTATGQTVATLQYANGALSLYLGGTFTGSVQLMALPNLVPGDATPAPMIPLGATAATVTAPGLYVYPFVPGDYSYSVHSSGTWTGTANVVLSAAPRN